MKFSPASDNEMKSDNLARSLAMMEDELKRAEERVKIAEERVSELNSIWHYQKKVKQYLAIQQAKQYLAIQQAKQYLAIPESFNNIWQCLQN